MLFREEDAEDYFIDMITSKNFGFKKVESHDGHELTLDTIPNYVGVTPFCLLGISNEDSTDLDTKGTAQRMDVELVVYVGTMNQARPNKQSGQMRLLCRQIRNLLRGSIYKSGSQVVNARFVHNYPVVRYKGLAVNEMQFTLKVLDSNE